ncbi:esterase-like activity of phytase family protein [Sulfurimonas sp.]|uniref:esterase-like activity of phytase family protein n=1 Tax=Sulfurimonas sp. TaxID=2022749 RepID=UPI002630F3D4|nr:esterase-like activity of phytase family protein [Sulfurimonas sp.]
MLKLIFIFTLLVLNAVAQITAFDIRPFHYKSSTDNKIKVLDAKLLHIEALNGVKVSELSGLAYRNGVVYAVGDKGYLYTFSIDVKNSKIDKLILTKAYRLQTKNGKKLDSYDSEGLDFMGDDLLISFERKHRVDLYTTDGIKIKSIKINNKLKKLDNYKSENKGLESVTFNYLYGVVTAPEKPLINVNKSYHRLYTKHDIYKFKAKGSVTGLEFINDTKILVLLRNFNYLTRRRKTSLVSVDLNDCDTHHVCKSELLALFDSSKGWHIDNFEGLTKIGKNKFLMISDDNDSFFQKTLLVLFEIRN